MIKYISFDLDGTLSNEKFDKILWNEELPKLYSETHHVSLDNAKMHVFAEFYKALFIEKIHNFTDVSYWFKRHRLNNWQELLDDMHQHFFIYPDAKQAVEFLKQKYQLIIISSSDRKMLEVKIGQDPFKDNFQFILSTPSDFKISMKNREAYQKLFKILKCQPDEIVHIGDNRHMDYNVPSSIGIRSYQIDREHLDNNQDGVIHSLLELKDILG